MAEMTKAFESDTSVALAKLLESTIVLERNQERTTAVLEGMMAGLKEIRSDVTDIENIVHERARTQWSVIFGTVGAATAMLGLIGTVVAYAWISDIKRVETVVDRLANQFHEHSIKAGHPEGVLSKIEGFRDQVRNDFAAINGRLDRYDDRISELQKRTGVLFKEGEPY